MDIWNFINYLQCEQAALKERHEKLVNLVGEILEAVKHEELKRLHRKTSQFRCKYYNKGFCKEGNRCEFFHPQDNCQEFECSGQCSQGSSCKLRHPRKCRYWLRGDCWRLENCVYLHNEEDFDKENIQTVDEDEVMTVSDDDYESKSENEDKTDDINEEDKTKDINEEDKTNNINEEDKTNDINEGSRREITTDEILQMYENVEMIHKEGENGLTTDEILEMYATDDVDDKQPHLKSSSRKSKRKKSVSFEPTPQKSL